MQFVIHDKAGIHGNLPGQHRMAMPAQPVFGLEQGHLMPLCQQPGGGQAGNSGSGHGDLFPLGHMRSLHSMLVIRGRAALGSPHHIM
jgi:hypothetical protein